VIDLRPAGLSFARWRRAISVSPLNHDQINSGQDILKEEERHEITKSLVDKENQPGTDHEYDPGEFTYCPLPDRD